MENCKAISLIKPKRRRRPTRPCPPAIQKIHKKMLYLQRNKPELFKLEMAKIHEELANWKRIEAKPIIEDLETRNRRAAKITRPVKVVFIPGTIRDTSEEATYTKSEAKIYMELANTDPRLQVFTVLNPATGLPDEAFTACVIKRYRNDQCDSGLTAPATADDVQGTSFVLKSLYEDLCKSSETMVDVLGKN
ncbi:uncharacterized protein [Rutidosis leptorrhynchoides]|uniref:uncharacterized protein isoform X2 n=1 Tax=Rutidosis leptorrhynchoides TaxID=125765 RepID=UPI003A999995